MTIPDKGMLRNAIDLRRPYYEANMDRIKNFYGMNENKPKKSRDDFIFEAAQTLLTLLDHIGEDRLRGLLDGSMVVVPSQELDRSSTVERAAHNSRGCGFDSRRSDQVSEVPPLIIVKNYPYPCGVGFTAPARRNADHDAEIAALDAEIERGTQRDKSDREDR